MKTVGTPPQESAGAPPSGGDQLDPSVIAAQHAAQHRLAQLFRRSVVAEPHPLLGVMQRYFGVPAGLPPTPPSPPAPAWPPPQRLDMSLLHQRVGELPSLPAAVQEAMNVLRNEDASSDDVALCIERDPALAARTLRIANSPFYGVSGRVANIRTAISILGLRTVATLLTTAAVAAQFPAAAVRAIDMGAYWRHALGTALVSRGLARALRMDENLAFTAGLLHDIGRLALAVAFPGPAALASNHAIAADLPLVDVQRRLLGTDQTVAGVMLSTHWNFPASVVEAIARHHAPAGTALNGPSLSDLVHVAHALANGLGPLTVGNAAMPATEASAWRRLGLGVDACVEVLRTAEAGVASLCEALSL